MHFFVSMQTEEGLAADAASGAQGCDASAQIRVQEITQKEMLTASQKKTIMSPGVSYRPPFIVCACLHFRASSVHVHTYNRESERGVTSVVAVVCAKHRSEVTHGIRPGLRKRCAVRLTA